jgi:hypothetical protein
MALGFFDPQSGAAPDATAGSTPEQVDFQRKYAQQLLAKGMQPVNGPAGPWQLFAMLGPAIGGGIAAGNALDAERQGKASLGEILAGTGSPQDKMAALARNPWGQDLATSLYAKNLGESISPKAQMELATQAQALKHAQAMDPLQQQATKAQIAASENEFKQVGQDEFNRPINAWVKPGTQTITPATVTGPDGKPISGVNSSAAGTPLDGLSGDDFLEGLRKQYGNAIANQVKGIASGEQPMLPVAGRASQRNQQIMAWVQNYDPTFSGAKWTALNSANKNFLGSGPESRNLTAITTSLHHLVQFDDAIDKLGNWNVAGGTALRHITNQIAAGVSPASETKIKNFNTVKDGVAEEVEKVLHGGSNVAAVEAWKQRWSDASSPQALHGSIAEAIQLMQGRADELHETYVRGTGREPPRPFVRPEIQQGFDALKKKAALWNTLGRKPTDAELTKAGAIVPQASVESSSNAAAKIDHGPLVNAPTYNLGSLPDSVQRSVISELAKDPTNPERQQYFRGHFGQDALDKALAFIKSRGVAPPQPQAQPQPQLQPPT